MSAVFSVRRKYPEALSDHYLHLRVQCSGFNLGYGTSAEFLLIRRPGRFCFRKEAYYVYFDS